MLTEEAFVGGKGCPNKQLVLVAAEANGRVRLAHAENHDAATLEQFADDEIGPWAHVTTDGHTYVVSEPSMAPRRLNIG